METRFSQRLSMLMKERKISGQKIGDAIGKSQKTISRYANGEVDPNNKTKNAIYRVIADISGIEEDATTEEELDSQEDWDQIYQELCEEFEPGCYEWELGLELSESMFENYSQQETIFHNLSLGAKKYYIKHIDTFLMVENWECCVLDLFHEFSPCQQKNFITYLENFNFNFERLRNSNNACKISAYMDMIIHSENRPMLIIEKKYDDTELSIEEKELEDEYTRIMDNKFFNTYIETLTYPDFLSFTPYDWYVLLRIAIFEMYDSEPCLWSQEESEIYIGSALDTLLGNIRMEK